jgi:hypothetical protein
MPAKSAFRIKDRGAEPCCTAGVDWLTTSVKKYTERVFSHYGLACMKQVTTMRIRCCRTKFEAFLLDSNRYANQYNSIARDEAKERTKAGVDTAHAPLKTEGHLHTALPDAQISRRVSPML